jgi:hypothetical protein
MAIRTVKVINCKTASIRRTPWIPLRDQEIVGIKSGQQVDGTKVKMGSFLRINTKETCYDWTGRKFYKVLNPEGWIYEGCVDYIDTSQTDIGDTDG